MSDPATTPAPRSRWLGRSAVGLAIVGLVTSPAMGGSWLLAVLAMLASSVAAVRGQRGYALAVLPIAILHVLVTGPLAGIEHGLRSLPPPWFLAVFVAFPFAAVASSLYIGARKR